MVRVTFIGSGDAFGSGGRFQTCILVDGARSRFLIDCGASSMVAMKKQRVVPGSIEAILLTHLHGDHFAGIPFFILDAQFSGRRDPLVIAGPPGTETRVKEAMEVLFPRSSQTKPTFTIDFVELRPRVPASVAGAVVTAYEALHFAGAPAYSLRAECDGRVIGYSGDGEWTECLLEVAAGADLFICEAYFFDKKVKFHLDYTTLSAHLEELHCKRLIVTHMSDDMLRRLSEVQVEAAEDGKIIAL